ncbi:MAG: DUF2225 domain-containing protein [SAR324 cluster bacterium]|nr:DUF2225 domain-containing protein [SAR324 cluster bacterium]
MSQLDLETLPKTEKRWLAKAIATMICADGHVDSSEMEYLSEAIGFLDDRQEIAELMEQVKLMKPIVLDPMPIEPQKAFFMLKQLVRISISDGRITPSEITCFRTTGGLLGFPVSVTNKILYTAVFHLEHTKPHAELIFSDHTENVLLWDVNIKGCTFKYHRSINPHSRLSLRVLDAEGNPVKSSISIAVQRAAPSDLYSTQVYMVRAVFQGIVHEQHGILQLIYPEKYAQSNEEQVITCSNNSLMGKAVSCYICGQNDIVFWHLRSHAMITQSSLFNIPVYTQATDEHDFCDYSLLQITVCPKCYYASDDISYFKAGNSRSPISISDIQQKWLTQTETLRKSLALSKDFYTEKRSIPEAIQTYSLALKTCDAIAKIKEDSFFVRKAVSFLMNQAELYARQDQQELAEANLHEVVTRLEPVYTDLQGESMIRSVLLLSLIKLYFGQKQDFGRMMNFFATYESTRKSVPTLGETKAFKLAKERIKAAYDQRDNFNYAAWKNSLSPQK